MFCFRPVEALSLCLGPPFRSPVPIRGFCGFFPGLPDTSLLFITSCYQNVCLVLGAGHILQDEYCFLANSFSVERLGFGDIHRTSKVKGCDLMLCSIF